MKDSDICEGLACFEAIQIFGDKHKVRVQGGYGFDARIDRAADFCLLLRFRGEITVVGISDEMVLQAKRVDRFCKVRREGDDAMDGLRHANRAADFICNLAIRRRSLERLRGRLGMAKRRAGKWHSERGQSHTS